MDDLISRQAVIKAFSEWRDDDDYDLWQVIDSVPAVEPCEDAVSRQAAIRACGGYMVPVGIIKALPPA